MSGKSGTMIFFFDFCFLFFEFVFTWETRILDSFGYQSEAVTRATKKIKGGSRKENSKVMESFLS